MAATFCAHGNAHADESVAQPAIVAPIAMPAPSSVARPRYDVAVTVDVDARTLDVRAHVDLPSSYVTPTLWLYADRLRRLPPSFDEFEAERIFPGGADFGGYDALTVTVAGCAPQSIAAAAANEADPIRGRDVAVAVCESASRPLVLDVVAKVTIPRRYGSLGAACGEIVLGDPWYPLVLDSADRPKPPLADHVVNVRIAGDDDPHIVATAGGVMTIDATHPVAGVTQHAVSYAPLVVLPAGHAFATEQIAGVALSFVTDSAATYLRSIYEGDADINEDFTAIDAAGFIHGTVRDAVHFLRELGWSAAPGQDAAKVRGMAPSLVVVEIPERQHLTVNVPGMLLVSDHIFRLTPWNRVRQLHAIPLYRAALAELAEPHVRATFDDEDRPWAADMDGKVLADLRVTAANGTQDGAQSLIENFGFHPSVDELLYAPKVAFAGALFGSIEELDKDRPGVDRARNGLPTGRFVVEKLTDRIGAAGLTQAARAHLTIGTPWRRAANDASGQDLSYFWRQWIGPHRALSYAIAGVADRETADQRGKAVHQTTVTITRLGETWIREPVVVQVVDKDGTIVRGVWDAPGDRGEVVVTTPKRFSSVTIDPDGRLAEDASLVDHNPRYDNVTSHAWRLPVFAAANAAYGAGQFDFDLDFTMRRKFDVDEAFEFAASRTVRGYSATAGYGRAFGPLRDLNSRLGGWTVSVSGERDPNGFAGDTRPVNIATLGGTLTWDTVRQIFDPLTGYGGTITASTSVANVAGVDLKPNFILSARGHVYLWEHVRTVTVLIATAGVLVGHAYDSQLLGLAGRQYLRAFQPDELLGRTRALIICEQRIRVLSGVYWNMLHATWFKALELVPWVAAGAISSPDSTVDFAGKGHLVGEIGGGVRFLHEYGGVQTGVLAIDVALPIGRANDCAVAASNGACVTPRPPIGFWVSVQQTY